MKKFLLILSIILFSISLSSLIFFEFRTNNLKHQNKILEKEISRISNNNEKVKEENITHEENINELKSEKEVSIKEVNIWKETKEKIEKALS